MPLPSTKQLLAFGQVARLGSFRRAAEALHLSQPALSHTISQLEQQLETQLLERTTRSIKLTDAGRVLFERSTRLLHDLEAAVSDTRSAGQRASATVRIGFIYSATRLFIPHALAAFQDAHPDVKVIAVDATPAQLALSVLEGKLDFAITSATDLPSRDLRFAPLLVDRFQAVLRRDHRLAECAEVTWSQLMEHDFIAPSQGSAIRRSIDIGLAHHQLAFRPSMEVAQLVTVNNLVEAGLGVTALPQLACPDGHAAICSRPLVAPVLDRRIGILTRRDAASSGPSVDLRALVVERVKS